MSKKLEAIRGRIDALDDQIHDLLMRRATLIADVTAEKLKYNKPIVHPAREAAMLRRLLSRHQGVLPQAAVIGIWRELVGAVSMLQRGIKAFVSTDEQTLYCWDMAKDYCGSVVPMQRVASPGAALSAVRESTDAIAVVPWPGDQDQNRLWWELLIDQDVLRNPEAYAHQESHFTPVIIIAALPFGSQQAFNQLENKALVVGRMEYNPSGEDNSFVAMEVQGPLSRARAVDLLKKEGFEALSITSVSRNYGGQDVTRHLIEVSGYIDASDERLDRVGEWLQAEETPGFCVLLGGYPVPPVLRAGDTAPLAIDRSGQGN